MHQKTEVHDHNRGDKDPKNSNKFSLGEEIGFAGFINQFRNVLHGFMNRKSSQLDKLPESKNYAQNTDQQTTK